MWLKRPTFNCLTTSWQRLDGLFLAALRYGQSFRTCLTYCCTMIRKLLDRLVWDTDWNIGVASYSSLHIRYPPGELIYQAETYAAGVSLIEQGLVANHQPIQANDLRPPLLEVLGPGDLIGLDALCEHRGRLHLSTARAVGEVAVCFFEREVFLRMLDDKPSLCRYCLDQLNLRFHSLSKLASLSMTASLEERLCDLLLAITDRFGDAKGEEGVLLPSEISDACLSELLGVSRRRVRQSLARLPEVRQEGERLVVSAQSLRQRLANS